MTALRPTMRQLQVEVRRLRERIKDFEAEGVLLALLVKKAERLGCWWELHHDLAAGSCTAKVGSPTNSLVLWQQVRPTAEEALAAVLKLYEGRPQPKAGHG